MRHSSPSPIVSDDDFKEYLNLVTLKEVSISAAASQLIQKYFVASRRAQPERLPVNAVGIITSLSEAYARLTLKDEVTPEHVIAVLQLYEESLCYLHGVSVINAPPPVVLSSGIFTPQ
ncbi:Minichromosome maintenance domain-containing protein 2, partial [Gryllus bimaculatus]